MNFNFFSASFKEHSDDEEGDGSVGIRKTPKGTNARKKRPATTPRGDDDDEEEVEEIGCAKRKRYWPRETPNLEDTPDVPEGISALEVSKPVLAAQRKVMESYRHTTNLTVSRICFLFFSSVKCSATCILNKMLIFFHSKIVFMIFMA